MPTFESDVELKQNQLVHPRIHNASFPPANPRDGQLYYNTQKLSMHYWAVDHWVNIDPPLVYIEVIGNGTQTDFVIRHNLGTRSVRVNVYTTASPITEIFTDVVIIDENSVSVKFGNPPAIDEFTVYVTADPSHIGGDPGDVGNGGIVGPTGPQGIQGIPGATGPAGIQGSPGIPGPKGATGPQGLTGDQGPPGSTGPAGPIGATGPRGTQGIDGSVGTQGPVGATGSQGAMGPIGPAGLLWRGTYAPATSYAANDVVSYNGASYFSTVAGNVGNTPDTSPASWALLASQGPQGQQGPAGAQGQQGTAGPSGATGPVGPVGATGPVGPVGPQGPTGASGPPGATGSTGLQGQQGIQGVPGPAGQTGQQGTAGVDGAIGATGPKGNVGPEGATGATGPQGETGPAGNAGDLFAYKTYDSLSPHSTTTVNVPEMTVSVAANARYVAEMIFFVQASGGTDFRYAFSAPVGLTANLSQFGPSVDQATATGATGISSLLLGRDGDLTNTAVFGTVGGSPTTDTIAVQLRGVITTTNAGSLQLKFGQGTVTGLELAFRIGSYMHLKRIS